MDDIWIDSNSHPSIHQGSLPLDVNSNVSKRFLPSIRPGLRNVFFAKWRKLAQVWLVLSLK
jgi:hypothetical protein